MNEHSEKIQDYIQGHLQGEELSQFEAQLAIDLDLRNMLSLQKEVNAILNNHTISIEIESRRFCNNTFSNFRYTTEEYRATKNDFLWMASALTLMIIVGVVYFTLS